MLRLENPEYLYLLFFVPVLIGIYILMRFRRKAILKKYGEINLINRLFPDVSNYKPIVKLSLILFTFSLLVIGIANPQLGTKLEESKREGVDVIIALDVSNSMNADDVKPSRLERAKQFVSTMVDKLQNDRIGIIVFAGDAFLELPLTTDYSAAKLFLSYVNTGMVEVQGTAIGAAIELAIKSFKEEDKKYKSLIIITDGENHEDDAIGAATDATKTGIIINTIGMGSVNGAPIPIMSGNSRSGFMKDNEGNVIVTKLDAAMLQQIASAGNGKFIRSAGTDPDLPAILDQIAGMEKRQYSSKLFTDYVDWFQWFLGAALIFLIVEFIIAEKKNKYIASLNLFGAKKT
ncbi:MAG: VWA domain-containing protein [FCB group bacterium]|jgi:Ca-activated chloride channel family protein